MAKSHGAEIGPIKIEVLARIAQGALLKDVCAQPGMPVVRTVLQWASKDPLFGPELKIAYARGAYRRMAFDPAKAKAFIARMAAGERIKSILNDPEMPGRRTYQHWLTLDVTFAEDVHRLKGDKAAARVQRSHERRMVWDPDVGDRILGQVARGRYLRELLKSDPSLPCLDIVRRWRREQPEFDKVLRRYIDVWRRRRGQRPSLCTSELTQRIVDHLVEGHSLHSIGKMPGMPAGGTLYEWVAKRPDFAAAVAQACVDREDWYNDRIFEIELTATPRTATETARRAGPLKRQLTRLRHRPGAKRRRATEAAISTLNRP